MGCLRRLLLLNLVFWMGNVAAQDRLSVNGDLDLRWVQASGVTSFLNGGLGILRFDSEHEGLQLGRALLAPNWRATDILSVHAVINAYGDGDRNAVDLSEFYLQVRPFPAGPIRWRARLGAFFMPVSLENRGIGWSNVYSITPSAVNTWMGEEFRTIGAELEARWLGASSGYFGEVALVAAAYGWNDPAGVLLSSRGFGLSDRPSELFGGLGRPPLDFYHEIDRKPGYYGGLSWKHQDWLEVRALRYDNHGDPGAETAAGGYAWRTRFSSFGARIEPLEHWTLVAQYLDGNTAVGADSLGDEQFYMRFHADFVLASFEWVREQFAVRYDDFDTHQVSGFHGPPSDETGHGWMFAWSHRYGEHWQSVVEWLRVASVFPPRIQLGESAAQVESQFQLAVRYRFKLAW